MSNDSKSFTDLRPSAQAALRGKEPEFQRFLQEHYNDGMDVSSEDHAADLTRTLCGVGSRSVLDRDDDAAARWREINAAYEAKLAESSPPERWPERKTLQAG